MPSWYGMYAYRRLNADRSTTIDLVCTSAADNHDLPAHMTAGHSKMSGVMAIAACNDVTDLL